jgi:hypothetical protein
LQIREQTEEVCIPTVVQTINNLGGVNEDAYLARRIDIEADGSYQLGLFDLD